MLVILSIMTFWCLTPAQPMTYPVVGAKQYQHQVPYYNQYYDQQPQQQVYVPPAAYQQHGYINENGYYYYPRHEYHTYGLPTYRGEYKPSPYYYAPGPSYSYYDDRDIAPNPLDDLHEEMLQEDERERQREMIPVIGQESWYENNRRQDDLTNNFLRNLIAYNRQIDAQQPPPPPMQLSKDEPSEYDEYSDLTSPEYEYDPQPDSPYNYQKYDKQFPQQDKYDEIDEDEDERQLKSLAHSHQKSMNNMDQKHDDGGYQDTYNTNNNNNNWQQSASSFAQYDVDPEYDDSWINWDRKRSNLDSSGGYQSDESIKAFSNRKPSPVVQYFEKTMSTKKPSSVATTKSTTVSSSSASSSTTTTTTSQPIKGAKVSGQKEVVLPRPASPVQQIFAAPVLEMIGNTLPKESDDDKRSEEGGDKSVNIYETIKQLIAMEQQLERNTGSKIQKRFVSSEESLVSELDSLKRHAAA